MSSFGVIPLNDAAAESSFPWLNDNMRHPSPSMIPLPGTDGFPNRPGYERQDSHLQQSITSGEPWPSLQGFQFHHLNQSMGSNIDFDDDKPFGQSFRSSNSHTLLNVPSLDFRDDCSTWSASPATPASKPLAPLSSLAYDSRQTIPHHHRRSRSLNESTRGGTEMPCSIISYEPTIASITPTLHNFNIAHTNPIDLLDRIQESFASGVQFGLWEQDANVLSWLHRTRCRFTNRLT